MAKKRRGRKPVLERVSIATLERALSRRKAEADALAKKREALRKELADVEKQLNELQGKAAAAAPAAEKKVTVVRRRRRRGGLTLNEAVGQVLQSATGSVRAADVLEGVKALGYKSKAKDLKQIVHTALTQHPNAKRVARGEYVYDAAGATGKGKKRAGAKATG